MTRPEQESPDARVRRYPLERYPVQHATAQFHLGAARLAAGDPEAAVAAFTSARRVFARAGLGLEVVKATNMMGIARQEAGRAAEAAAAFRAAREGFATLGKPAEEAAASFNLGLALRNCDDLDGARAAWTAARERFLGVGREAQAAACARELGALLLAVDPAAAEPLLEEATALAERAGDLPALGASSNVLGLAFLALGRPAAATEAFQRALAAFPRSVRPEEYAMAKVNLALAYAQTGQQARARLVARQALAVPGGARPVRDQARRLLAQLPDTTGDDLLAALDEDPPARWPGTMRDEVLRLLDSPPADRQSAVASLLTASVSRPGWGRGLVQTLLDVLLELPPAAYDVMARALITAAASCPPEQAEGLRAVLLSAMARFPLPQWERLARTFRPVTDGDGTGRT